MLAKSKKVLHTGDPSTTPKLIDFHIGVVSMRRVKEAITTPEGEQSIVDFLDDCIVSLNRFKAQFNPQPTDKP